MADTPSLGNILVVDDDIYICELLQVNLGSEGYSVAVEPDASKVAEMPLDTVQLIIVDAMKQEYSGMDLIYDLKDNPDTEGIALILYSPVKSERMAIDALEAVLVARANGTHKGNPAPPFKGQQGLVAHVSIAHYGPGGQERENRRTAGAAHIKRKRDSTDAPQEPGHTYFPHRNI